MIVSVVDHFISPSGPTLVDALPSLPNGREKKENLMLVDLGKLSMFGLTLTFYQMSLNQ